MQLCKIKGNTYYIPAPTNVGVFLFKDKYTLLIDSGNHRGQARKISDTLVLNELNPKYILNTHHHIDHSGGIEFFKENYPATYLYTSYKEKVYIENPELFTTQLYGAYPIKKLRQPFSLGKDILVDEVIEEGFIKINKEKFDVLSLPGHTEDQLGMATKDKVCFLADSLMSEEILEKYKMPFLVNIEKQFLTYEKIKSLEYDHYVLNHGSCIYNPESILNLVQKNQTNLENYLSLCLELLEQPKTREELLEEIIILEDLKVDTAEYYFLFSTLGAMLSYLEKEGIDHKIENGKLYFYQS